MQRKNKGAAVMKKYKILIASFISLALLTGCEVKDSGNEISDIPNDNTGLTTSILIDQQENNNIDNQNTILTSTQQPDTSNSEQNTQNNPETTPTQSLQEQQANSETSISSSTEIFESELLPETIQSDTTDLYPDEITKYTDKYSGKKFIILNVTPNKVYWNELDGYNITQGQSLDIPIPAVFEDWISESDEIMIYMSNSSKTFGDLLLDSEINVKGMTYPQYWSRDYLCPIVDGTVQFREYTDEIIKSFSRVDDGVYIEEANYQYSENPFDDGMSIGNLDTYFETIKKDHDALMKKMEGNPNTSYDVAGFWGYQDGVRFRATINYIH